MTRFNFNLPPQVKELITVGAALEGSSATDFVIRAAIGRCAALVAAGSREPADLFARLVQTLAGLPQNTVVRRAPVRRAPVRRQQRRGTCPVCIRKKRLRVNGALMAHAGQQFANGIRQTCAGSGQSPRGEP